MRTTTRVQRLAVVLGALLILPLLANGRPATQGQPKVANDVCAAGNTSGVCSAPNTCGSAASACEVDINRTVRAASATPNIPNAKKNAAFCVKVGTTITFKSAAKNTGFVLDFGNSSPFDSGPAVMGGSDRPVSVVAKKPGCYTYSVGACIAGSIYGMCSEAAAQIVVSGS
jgi:hypothetical protein